MQRKGRDRANAHSMDTWGCRPTQRNWTRPSPRHFVERIFLLVGRALDGSSASRSSRAAQAGVSRSAPLSASRRYGQRRSGGAPWCCLRLRDHPADVEGPQTRSPTGLYVGTARHCRVRPICIEVEAPAKRWFTKDRRPHGRDGEFREGGRQVAPHIVRRKRDHLPRQRKHLFTYDMLSPEPKARNYATLRVHPSTFTLAALPPTYTTGPESRTLAAVISDPSRALARTELITAERRRYITKRWAHWRQMAHEEGRAAFQGDGESDRSLHQDLPVTSSSPPGRAALLLGRAFRATPAPRSLVRDS